MSIMDPHPHSTASIGRGNAAGQALFDNHTSAKVPTTVTASTLSTTENTNPSSSTPHSHHHPHNNHHQFVDSSTVYHHPFRTITPNSAESNNKILDPQPQSKSSTPTNQHPTQSRPSSGSNPDWSVAGIGPPQPSQPAPNRRPFSSSAPLDGPASREPPPTSSGTGTGYHSPTATPASRRSSSIPNPSPNSAELISPITTSSSTTTPSYYQHHSGQDQSLAMITAIDCNGLDVRQMYNDDSRHAQGQGLNQGSSENPSQNHTRASVQTSEEVRASYYAPPPTSHYNPPGSGMLPSHYPHLSPPLPVQPAQRRTTSASSGGPTYGSYHNLSVPVPLGGASYGHHQQHHHHTEGPVVPSWTPSVDSVRDTVSPYSRPPRSATSGPLSGHHTSSTSPPFGQALRSGPLLHSHHSNSPTTAHHHQSGTMQYNAQGRPLAYMCNTCLRAFDRPSALQIHERSHTGERPFPCPWNGCVKRFTTHGNMVKHSRVCPFREPED